MVKALSAALAPVFLITGVGALLGAMNLRYGRVVDRARAVLREAKADPASRQADVDHELRILLKRARLLRVTVILASLAIFSVSLCIFVVFLETLIDVRIPLLSPAIFIVGLSFLIASLLLFIEDFAVSLRALKREIQVALGRTVAEK